MTKIKQFFKNQFSYEKPTFCGIKNNCCTDENIFYYDKTDLGFFYQCRICFRLFQKYDELKE